MAAWRIGRPAQAALIAALAGLYLIADDAAVLFTWAINTPWMFSAAPRQPVGHWHGTLDVLPDGPRHLQLQLQPDLLSDADSARRSEDRNGFFVRRPHLYRGSPYLTGTLTITAATGHADIYQVEGPVTYRGTQATLNVHGADGHAGVLIEQAVTTFTPPYADLVLRYRVPAGSIRKPAPVFSYSHAGVDWTAANGPARAHLTRD